MASRELLLHGGISDAASRGAHVISEEAVALPVAVIDGPCDVVTLLKILAHAPVALGVGSCSLAKNSACDHGTFIMGLLGAKEDALIPGLCPNCKILHVPLFVDDHAPSASIAELANAIEVAVAAGARLINLSLATQGDDAEYHRDLAKALDYAEASGAVVVAAAGNQGRLATGRILSHPVTVPVVAVDAARRLLPDCNFGPSISRRGVAALGYDVPGYAPGGRTVVMSGTSVATAVATGILARAWAARPDADGAAIRAAVARLAPRNGPAPPVIDLDALLAALVRMDTGTMPVAASAERGKTSYVRLQGGMTMNEGNGLPRSFNHGAAPVEISGPVVTPAQGLGGCGCGAPSGQCTCANGGAPSNFVYVLGTVDIDFPDQSIADELRDFARSINAEQTDTEDLRSWCHRVLTVREELRKEARYIARQLCWILRVENQPAYYLALRDLNDLDDLVRCLARPEREDLCLFVGTSPLTPVDMGPGIMASVLAVDQLCIFKQEDLVDGLKKWLTEQSKEWKKAQPKGDPKLPNPFRAPSLCARSNRAFQKVHRQPHPERR